MNENARKWLDALRSGEYTKGRLTLRPDKDTYCVLGVACEVFHRETKRGHWRKDGSFEVEHGRNRYILPYVVREWLGATSELNEIAMRLNDRTLMTFPEIAAEIEARAGRVFR